MVVRLLDGRRIVFKASMATYVAQVMNAVQRKVGIPREDLVLIANGERLRDDKQFGDYSEDASDFEVVDAHVYQKGC